MHTPYKIQGRASLTEPLLCIAWEEALENLREFVVLPDPAPAAPEHHYISLDGSAAEAEGAAEDEDEGAVGAAGKRKAGAAASKKTTKKSKTGAESARAKETGADTAESGAQKGFGFTSVLKAEDLRPPKLLSAEEMDKVIVAAQKKQLLAQYALQD